jgi:hypothetical protein
VCRQAEVLFLDYSENGVSRIVRNVCNYSLEALSPHPVEPQNSYVLTCLYCSCYTNMAAAV